MKIPNESTENQTSEKPVLTTAARSRSRTSYIALMGILAALSVAMMYMLQIPLIPAAPFLLYDMADIPILIGTLFLGPTAGLILTVIVAVIQGVTVNASGSIIGVIMHILATGAFVLTTGLLRKAFPKHSIFPVVSGMIAMTLIMIPANLILTPLYTGSTAAEVANYLVPAIIPFNLLKAGINGSLALGIFQLMKRAFPRFYREPQRFFRAVGEKKDV